MTEMLAITAESYDQIAQTKELQKKLSDAALRDMELNETIRSLRNQMIELHNQWQRDIDTIGEALIEAAGEHGQSSSYCGDYDNAIDNLNPNLTYKLPLRPKERYLEFTVRVPVLCTDDQVDEAAADAERLIERIDDSLQFMSNTETVTSEFERETEA